eukprot:TRINITY_DN57763_c0_g1_i1.p1 TRINITY_DN57763_c0_g1~~TRINITY_DN57763_c0_g1_i1.p1  ORF type:complete len:543 (-),score=67.66 TRINITY_DN57763_c0_g1_i1:257-1792(-)
MSATKRRGKKANGGGFGSWVCGAGFLQVAGFLIGVNLIFFVRFRGSLDAPRTGSEKSAALALRKADGQHVAATREVKVVPVTTVQPAQQSDKKDVHLPVLMPMPVQSNFAGQWIHWVVVTHCSPQTILHVHMMLSSAAVVGQPGEFTWILYGCRTEKQWTYAESHNPHPRCRIWRATSAMIRHPVSQENYGHLLDVGRSALVARWWKSKRPPEQAIGILSADFIWLRPVHMKENPRGGSYTGPWETSAAKPKEAIGARYAIGCTLQRFEESEIRSICGERMENCQLAIENQCDENYASGPPWILHRDDVDKVLGAWPEAAVRMHEKIGDIAELGAFGVAQMQYGVKSELDSFWFVSVATDQEDVWNAIAQSKYDPCQERKPPSAGEAFPPLYWSCCPHEIPYLQNMGYKIHKNHIPADFLNCEVGLLTYPPRDALEKYTDKEQQDFRETWMVCMYTNVLNSYARLWKESSCKKANIEPDMPIASGDPGFYDKSSEIVDLFPEGHAALPPDE